MDHDDKRLRMWTPDAPMVAFGQLELGTRKVVSRPDNGHLYNIICSTSWDTNFIHLRAGKLVVRNVIEEDTVHRALIDPFLAFPDCLPANSRGRDRVDSDYPPASQSGLCFILSSNYAHRSRLRNMVVCVVMQGLKRR